MTGHEFECSALDGRFIHGRGTHLVDQAGTAVGILIPGIHPGQNFIRLMNDPRWRLGHHDQSDHPRPDGGGARIRFSPVADSVRLLGAPSRADRLGADDPVDNPSLADILGTLRGTADADLGHPVHRTCDHRHFGVRVIDRGPFHADRIIDLSYTAAYKLGIIQNGSARVEVEAIVPGSEGYKNHVAPLRPVARINTPIAETQELSLASGVYLQLGAFSSADNADNLKRHLNGELNWLDRPMHIIKTDTLHRVQLGTGR